MINVNQITAQLARMPDQSLQRYAAMHKEDPYILSLALAESNRRKEMRAGAQMQAPEQPKVVDQAVASMGGLPTLPADNLRGMEQTMAAGGIVAFDDGGEVPRFNGTTGSVPKDLEELVLATAAKYNIRPDVAMRLVKQESGFNPNAKSKKGAVGLTQLMPETAEEMGLSKDDRNDPAKNLDAGFGYLRKQLDKYDGNYGKALAAYNWGGGNVDQHIQKNKGIFSDIGLPKETANYLTSILPMGSAVAADKAPAPDVATPATVSNPKQAWYDRYRELLTSGEGQKAMLHGVQDVPAALLGAPADIGAAVLRPFGYKQQPTMGSKWWEQKFQDLGIRVPDSANPDLQTIRAGTTGVASLVNPVAKAEAVETGLAAAARRQAQAAAEAEAAVKNPRLAGPTTDTTMVQKPGMPPVVQGQAVARQADDIARAQSEAAKAAELSKAAAAQKTSQFQTGVNPLAAVAAAGNAAPGVTALLQGQGQDQDQGGFDTGGFEDIGQQMGTSGVQDLQQMQAQAPETTGGKGGLESLFTNPLFLMGARMMAGTSPFAMQNIGQAGVGTASDLLAQRRAEREEDYYSALAQRARALSKTEGLTGNTQLAYYLGEGETPEKRVKSGFNVLKALESSGDAFKHLEAFERTNMQREEKGLKPRSFADYWKQFQGFTMRAPAPIDTATNIRP